MFSPGHIGDGEITEGLKRAVEGAEPSARVWAGIEARIDPDYRFGLGLWWLVGRSVPTYIVALMVVFGATYGVWSWTHGDVNGPGALRTATFDSETRPLVEVGDELVTSTGSIIEGSLETDPDLLADRGDLAAQPESALLLQIPLEFETADDRNFEHALANLALTEFKVTSVQAGRSFQRSLRFDWVINDYWAGSNLPVDRIVREDDCVSSPIDVPEVGLMTVCQLYARVDGVNVGESYNVPVYRVTEGTYSPNGEATVRVDDRSISMFSVSRTRAYQGMVDQWRMSDGEFEHRNVVSAGNFDLIGDPAWRPADIELMLGSGSEIVEWLLAMQMPDSDLTGENVFAERFVPGAEFDPDSFFDLKIVSSPDESIIAFEAWRKPGFYGRRYGLERRTIGSGEMLRFEIDRETELPKRIMLMSESNLPYALQFSFKLPIVFEFEYPEQ